MNLFCPDTKITLRQMLWMGLLYSPGQECLLLMVSLLVGFLPAMVIHLQTRFIDFAASGHGAVLSALTGVCIAYFLVNLLDFNSRNLISCLNFKISQKIEKRLTEDFLRKIMDIAYADYENSRNQDIIYRLKAAIKEVAAQCVSFFPNILAYAIGLSGIFYYCFRCGVWWIIPISLFLCLPAFHFNKKRALYAGKIWERDSSQIRYADYLHGALVDRESARERKLYQFAEDFGRRWEAVFQKYNRDKISNYTKCSVATGIAMCFSMSNILIFGLALLPPLQKGRVTIGLYLSLMQMITAKFNMNINSLIREVSNLVKVRKFIDDARAFNSLSFEGQTENADKPEGSRCPSSGDTRAQRLQCRHERSVCGSAQPKACDNLKFESLIFEDVYFSYPGSNLQVLKGVSFEIHRGCRYALIGMNGAGKTTITRLMLGFYQPTKGRILLNGVELQRYSRRQLQSVYVCMQQEQVRYKATARENIGLYRLAASRSDTELDQFLSDNRLYEIKNKFKGDYDTLLTPELAEGVSLSGGEWQKAAFARTLFADRNFCILDEPTAALDPLAEVDFYRNFQSMMKDHTCFYITHRLGSTFLFEKCLVLHGGVIWESGSHEELMQNPQGLYRSLYDKQKAWYEATSATEN